MLDSVNADKDSCIISDKIKDRISADELENQGSLGPNFYSDHTSHQVLGYIAYANIFFNDKSSMVCVLDKIAFKNGDITTWLTLPPINSDKFLVPDNNIKKIEVINSDDSIIASYDICELIKKNVKFNDNKYIEVKLKFRK